MQSGKVYTWAPFLASVGIPEQATGLVGNLTMVAPSRTKLTGGGWMAIVPAQYANSTTMPSGYPGVSSLNTPTGTDACANQFTVALGTGSYAGCISICMYSASQPYHAIVDVAGFIV